MNILAIDGNEMAATLDACLCTSRTRKDLVDHDWPCAGEPQSETRARQLHLVFQIGQGPFAIFRRAPPTRRRASFDKHGRNVSRGASHAAKLKC